MKALFLLLLVFPVLSGLSFPDSKAYSKEPERVLVFSKTLGFRHKSILAGITAIRSLGQENGFLVDTTENAAFITPNNLKKYKAIIFLSPTGEVLDDGQKAAFKKYITSGGGFVGIHAATDCLYKWDWYGKMIGAYFESHPAIQNAVVNVMDTRHIATKSLSSPWARKDEWYNFKFTNSKVKVLLTLDESSYKGGKNGEHHPIAWYHEFEGGRIFYTGLGHTTESYTSDKDFLTHLLGGIKYALNRK